MKKNFKLGVIGCGFMAQSIILGAINKGVIKAEDVIVSDANQSQLDKLSKTGITTTLLNDDVFLSAEFVLLAIKPQSLSDVANSKNILNVKKIVTILAGVKKQNVKKFFANAQITRCMPNTPCSIGYGMTAIDHYDFDEESQKFVKNLFSALGAVLEISEDKMNAVTGISGSGPAYVYLFIKALTEAGVKQGLTYEQAKILATNTIIGSGQMVLANTEKSLDDLITAVCSKGGTTIEAVNSFNNDGLDKIVDVAVTKCVNRAKELGGETVNNTVKIYTDGACSGNPGFGGWACILMTDTKELKLSGGEEDTTNNRMELTAVIKGLLALKKCANIEIYTDSAYVVNAFEQGWIYSWNKNGWTTSSGDKVKNDDLWKTLLQLCEKYNPKFIKVKGHSTNEFNNECDRLAVLEWKKLKQD